MKLHLANLVGSIAKIIRFPCAAREQHVGDAPGHLVRSIAKITRFPFLNMTFMTFQERACIL